MSRIACLRIPRFQIVAHQKHEPDLQNKPFVLIGGRSRVTHCSVEADKRFVRTGMRLSEARAVCADLIWRDCDEKLCVSAQKELLANLVSCSPRVTSLQSGVFLMDADGLAHMGGENHFARSIIKFVSQKGYTDGSVGLADPVFAAVVAAQNKKRRWYIVPHGEDYRFLSLLPISYLPISFELRETLSGLGIESMGQLTGLPIEEVKRRFDGEGLYAYELASGIDRRRPTLPKIETSFQCVVDIGGPVESLNDTLFVIKSMLERLTNLIKQAGLCADELTICFYSDDELFEERRVRLIRPSNQGKFLLEVLRLSIENKRLQKEFTSIRLIVSRTVKETFKQMPLLSNDSTLITTDEERLASDSFLLLIQKLTTRYGDNVLVQPIAADQYMPEKAGVWQPVISSDYRSAVAVDYVKKTVGSFGLVSGLVLKRHAQPLPVFVELEEKEPKALTYEGYCYKIHNITTPECISGLWWEAPVRKSYYTALIQAASSKDFQLVMLVHDHEQQSWFIEGEYD